MGALLTGVFAEKAWNGTTNGLLFGNPQQLAIQAFAALVAVLFSAFTTFVLLRVISFVVRLRVNRRDEGTGLDVSQHGEEAYTTGEGAVLVLDYQPSETPSSLVAEGGRA